MSRVQEIPELGLIGARKVSEMIGVAMPTLKKMRDMGLFPKPEPFTSKMYPFWKKSVIEKYIKDMKK